MTVIFLESDTIWKLHGLRLHNLPLLGQISHLKVEILQGAVSFATHRQSTLPTEVSITCYGRSQANYPTICSISGCHITLETAEAFRTTDKLITEKLITQPSSISSGPTYADSFCLLDENPRHMKTLVKGMSTDMARFLKLSSSPPLQTSMGPGFSPFLAS